MYLLLSFIISYSVSFPYFVYRTDDIVVVGVK